MRLSLGIVLVFSCQAFAWGDFGHRTVGRLAESYICPKAKLEIRRLLGSFDLAKAATWADEIRQDPAYHSYSPWHYATVPLGGTYQTPSPRGDLVTALNEMSLKLRDASQSDAIRLEALRLILHFVGDAHQPLHAGQKEDGGGNGVLVEWQGQETNLHHLWDSSLLYHLQMRSDQLAELLINENRGRPQPELLTPEAWVNESSALAKQIYPGQRTVDEAYFKKHIGELKQRLWVAGLRLASMLNRDLHCPNLDPSP